MPEYKICMKYGKRKTTTVMFCAEHSPEERERVRKFFETNFKDMEITSIRKYGLQKVKKGPF